MKTKICFFEDSYQIKEVTTELNVTEDFIKKVLAVQYEYRPTTKPLWAEVSQNGRTIDRYEFNYSTGLIKL
jgi:hypothetical protein